MKFNTPVPTAVRTTRGGLSDAKKTDARIGAEGIRYQTLYHHAFPPPPSGRGGQGQGPGTMAGAGEEGIVCVVFGFSRTES